MESLMAKERRSLEMALYTRELGKTDFLTEREFSAGLQEKCTRGRCNMAKCMERARRLGLMERGMKGSSKTMKSLVKVTWSFRKGIKSMT